MNASSRTSFPALGAILLTSGLTAQSGMSNDVPTVLLTQRANEASVELSVTRATEPVDGFLGVILVSFRSELQPVYPDLPPMLGKHAVLAAGFATTTYTASIARQNVQDGLPIYAQGVIFDLRGVQTTAAIRLESSSDG